MQSLFSDIIDFSLVADSLKASLKASAPVTSPVL